MLEFNDAQETVTHSYYKQSPFKYIRLVTRRLTANNTFTYKVKHPQVSLVVESILTSGFKSVPESNNNLIQNMLLVGNEQLFEHRSFISC